MGKRMNRREDARGLSVKDSEDVEEDAVVELSDVSPFWTSSPKSGVKNKSHDVNTRIWLSDMASCNASDASFPNASTTLAERRWDRLSMILRDSSSSSVESSLGGEMSCRCLSKKQ